MYDSTVTTDSATKINTVRLRDDYIEVIWYGAQTAAKVRQSNEGIVAAAQELQRRSLPVCLSLCISDHPKLPNMGAFQEALKIFRQTSFERLVVSGDVSPMLASLITTVIGSFKSGLEMAYFKTITEASVWLRRAEV